MSVMIIWWLLLGEEKKFWFYFITRSIRAYLIQYFWRTVNKHLFHVCFPLTGKNNKNFQMLGDHTSSRENYHRVFISNCPNIKWKRTIIISNLYKLDKTDSNNSNSMLNNKRKDLIWIDTIANKIKIGHSNRFNV